MDDLFKKGDKINHYLISEKIGSGGNGEVYIADDTILKRSVAIKFLSSQLTKENRYTEQFLNEARAVASLNHPNIVTIYEVNKHLGKPFIVMEYLSGQTLEDLINEKELGSDEVKYYFIQICQALKAVHELNIIHRDIKPSNFVLANDGCIKLIDFGLAGSKQDPQLSTDSSRSGTIFFLSPEQIQNKEVDNTSDLFSLGVTLYYMLTGMLPFKGEYEASIIHSIVNDNPQTIDETNAAASPELAAVAMRLLEKNPLSRYQSADEIITELQPENSITSISRKTGKVFTLISFLLVLFFIYLFQFGFNSSSPVLAVLPFENIGSDDNSYLSEGITDAITMNLKRLHNLKVIARSSSKIYKEQNKSLKTIAEELGATHILTGTIYITGQSSNDSIQINTQLVDASDETLIWVEAFNLKRDYIHETQQVIASRVTSSLELELSDQPTIETSKPTEVLEAYDYYLKGNQYFYLSWTQEDLFYAIGMYEKSIELDSNFAAAYAMLSRGHAGMYWEYYDRSTERCDLATTLAQKALSMDNKLVEGHLALGYCFYNCQVDYESALQHFHRGLELQPNNAELFNAIAVIKRRQNLLSESTDYFRKALELDPRSHLKAFDICLNLGMMGQYDSALVYLKRTISVRPDWDLPYVYQAWLPIFTRGDINQSKQLIAKATPYTNLNRSKYYWWLLRMIEKDYEKNIQAMVQGSDTAVFYLQKSQWYRLLENYPMEKIYADSARVWLEQRFGNNPEQPLYNSYLSLAYTGLRQKDKAMHYGQRAVDLLPMSKDAFDSFFLMVYFAETMVIFKEYDNAVGIINELLSSSGLVSIPYLKIDPLWEPMHNHPGFKALLESQPTQE